MGKLLTSCTAAVVCMLALTSCGELPTGRRIDDGPAVRDSLSETLGMELKLAPPVRLPTGMANQSFSYYGATGREFVLALVFDREQAVRTVLGGLPPSQTRATRVLTYQNVVVFYTRIGSVPDRSEEILESLRRAL
jgi:hypothetical protein